MGIEEYLYNVLGNQLGEIKYRYRERILNDIKNRMCSLLSRWNQEDFRRTILFVTDEEALFYKPAAPKDVKRFVVAAIRNSMLEVAASVNCNELKMREPLSDEKIRIITSSAICYFKECQFETLQEEARNLRYIDVYGEAIQKYPLAWTVLKRAAAANNSEEEFEKIQGANQRNIGEDFGINTCKTAICDGYSLEFDDYLKETLGDVVSGRVEIFYVDSFKGLTRNFEKILHVLQIKFFQLFNESLVLHLLREKPLVMDGLHIGLLIGKMLFRIFPELFKNIGNIIIFIRRKFLMEQLICLVGIGKYLLVLLVDQVNSNKVFRFHFIHNAILLLSSFFFFIQLPFYSFPCALFFLFLPKLLQGLYRIFRIPHSCRFHCRVHGKLGQADIHAG